MRVALVLFALSACGIPYPMPEAPSDPIYPHDAAFIAAHGEAWKATGACTACHAVQGEAMAAGPACNDCHASYPHTPAILSGSRHGARWLADPAACSGCHGEAGDRAPAGDVAGTCTTCHTTYPHAATWNGGLGHGAAVLARDGTAACESCHGATLTMCASCHPSYPHPAAWAAPEAHGAAWTQGGPGACGTSCHGAPVEGGTPACTQCHAAYPHAADWTPTGHIPTVQSLGAGSCEGCHPAGSVKGPSIPNNCATACHGGGL